MKNSGCWGATGGLDSSVTWPDQAVQPGYYRPKRIDSARIGIAGIPFVFPERPGHLPAPFEVGNQHALPDQLDHRPDNPFHPGRVGHVDGL